MMRKIVEIDEEKCNGCGACAEACHEGAIAMIDGKARLIRDDYCDGLGDCLPACPVDAIRIIEREALPFDEEAVKTNQAKLNALKSRGCPGAQVQTMPTLEPLPARDEAPRRSRLAQFPVQIKLVPTNAPFFQGAKLLIAADCTAYAFADFHERFMKGRITLIGCPKLDGVNYAEKLTEIFRQNDLRSILLVRMQVPCCGGLEHAVRRALEKSGKWIPWQIVTIANDGQIVDIT
ncbi:MAG: ATP-binding protein [Saccharofermentanales bacterium]